MFDLHIEGGIARLAMNRPEARNAIPFSGWADLRAATEAAVRADARVLVLAGEPGGAFCAGADVSAFSTFHADPDARTAFRLAMRSGLDALHAMPIPTIAVVEGACFGAGVALAMACDVRLAGPEALFAITPARLGIGYPQEDVHQLVALVGPGQAARLLLTAGSIEGREAERIGLVERCVPAGLVGVVEEMAEGIAANDRDSLRMLKEGIAMAARGIASDEGRDRAFEDLLGSEALAVRLAAYRDRRR